MLTTVRSRELALLHDWIMRPDDAAPRFIEISGEPGIGKTWLLNEAVAGWGHDCDIWAGRGTEFEQMIPFGIFVDVIERQAGADVLTRFRRDHDWEAGLLAGIVPRLRRPGSPVRTCAPEERYHLYRSVRRLIEAAADRGRLALVLDDVHWADRDSAELLGYLLRHPPDGPVQVLVAHRPRQLPVRLGADFADAKRAGSLRCIHLGPFSRRESDLILGPGVSPALCEVLYRDSGGNPFYLSALRSAFDGGHGLTREPGPPASMTLDDIHALVLTEFDDLPADVGMVAMAAAVAGDPFERACVAAIAGLPAMVVMRGLDQLTVRDVVRREGTADLFSFRHPLVRQAIYMSAQRGWLLRAHSLGAQYLAARGLPVSARAHHVEVAARNGNLAAAMSLAAAAREIVKYAPATAARWLESAVQLIPVTADPGLAMRFELAYAFGVSGQFGLGQKVLTEVLSQLPGEAGEPRGRTAIFASVLERHLGQETTARALVEAELARQDVIAADDDGGQPAAVGLLLELCYQHMMIGEASDQHECARRAARLARVHRDRIREAGAAAQLALACYFKGAIGDARGHRERAASLIDAMSDEQLAEDLDVICHLGLAEVWLQSFGPGLRHAERALDLARGSEHGFVLAQALLLRAAAYRGAGDISAAVRSIEAALETARITGSRRWRMTALALHCELATIRGELALASAAGAEALRLATGLADDRLVRHVPAVLATARFLTGDAEGCTDAVIESFGGPDFPWLDRAARPRGYETLVWMEVLQGHIRQAQEWADRAEQESAGLGLPCSEGFALLARAEANLLVRPDDAVRHARESVARFRGSAARYEAGRATYTAGLAMSAVGWKEKAAALLAEAETVISECGGASPVAIGPLLAAGPASESPLGLLSVRERQIADLVARGATNRQVGRSLGISEKTVEAHLSRIFAKLDVPNRAKLASVVSQGEMPRH